MKKNQLIITAVLITTTGAIAGTPATTITIPDGSFEGVTASVAPPLLLGENTNAIGHWTGVMGGLLAVGGSMSSGTYTALNGPLPPSGNYELQIQLPANAAAAATLSQVLTNTYAPNSIYTLTVDMEKTVAADLVSSTTLSLTAGGVTLTNLSSTAIGSVLGTSTAFETVQLTYVTGATAPTNSGIGITLNAAGVASVAGDLYVDNFRLTVTPIQIQLSVTPMESSGAISLSGTGGAPYSTCEVITATNLAIPAAAWTVLSTNEFNASGQFNVNLNVNPLTPCRFYRVWVP